MIKRVIKFKKKERREQPNPINKSTNDNKC